MRKITTIVMLIALAGFTLMQSCNKEAASDYSKAYSVAMPASPTPAVDEIVSYSGTSQMVSLNWTGTSAPTAAKWTVRFGKTDTPPVVATNVATNSYSVSVSGGGVFYWQVSTVDANGIPESSELWSFDVNSVPDVPVLTSPANGATAVINPVLNWTATDPQNDNLTFDVLIGTSKTALTAAAAGISAKTFTPTLGYSTKYYWRIRSIDPYGGLNTSVVDSFTTDVFHPNFSVYHGVFSETSSTFGTHDVFVSVNTSANTITMYLPLADGLVAAGWGTQYTGAHPIVINYNPTTLALSSTKQLWTDSFIDPTEMGPMSLTVAAGSVADPTNKKLSIKWTLSGNAYWGGDYTTGTITYTMRVQK